MRVRMERFVLLPFTVGCVSESSIAVGQRQQKRSGVHTSLPPLRTREGEKEDEEEKYENADDNKISSGENLKSPSSIMALQRLQKLLKNFKSFSQLFAYKDELEEEEAQMDIGLPMDVKHVTHIGLDGFASAVHTRGWNSQAESESIDPYQFLLKPLESPVTKNADEQGIMRLLETKLRDYQGPKIDTKEMGHPK